MKRIILTIIAVLLVTVTGAQTFTVGDLQYAINEDNVSVTVTGHVEEYQHGALDIPETVSYGGTDYAVTAIGDNAFNGSVYYTSLSLPNTITAIGENAFNFCYGFTGSLVIPNSVIHIGNNAFRFCGFDGTLTIGDNVAEIGNAAFINCSFTGPLVIPQSLEIINRDVFRNCYGFTGSLTIPNSVVSIGICAFYDCDGFNDTLTIGSSVSHIGDGAFISCGGFTAAVSLAAEPPVLDATSGYVSVFEDFGCSMVIVPCGSKEAYENSRWHGAGGFENIMQGCEDVQEYGEEPLSVNVYPNPAKDVVSISLSGGDACGVAEICSADGRLMKSQVCDTGTIELSGLEPGLYIIKVSVGGGRWQAVRVIKE